jgi:hypothetical protein
MLSTTRLVYSNGNAALNKEFMRQLFARDDLGQPLALGEIVRRTKNTAKTGVNQLNFTLLGDPALRLHLSEDTLQSHTLRVDGVETDTLRALSRVAFTGSVANANDGDTIEVAVYDKIIQKQTLGNSGQTAFTYNDNTLIYKGLAIINDGKFEVNFVVPRDIGLAYGRGKITYFGKCDGRWVGGSMPIVVGGVSVDNEDITPPNITLYIDNEDFVDGGETSETPLFIAHIDDESGINLTGSGIGRNMTLQLVETQRSYILNPYYTANAGSSTSDNTSGSVRFPIPPLPQGTHTAVFKAFDVGNNSAERRIRFVVVGEPQFSISSLYNFPNPFGVQTTFFFTHNRPEAEMYVEIQIFSINGTLQRTLQYTIYGADTQRDYNFAMWDGRNGIGSPCPLGIYAYKIDVRTKDGEHTQKSGKLLYVGTR